MSRSVYTEVKNRVSDPYSFDTDPDPIFYAEYRSGFFWFRIRIPNTGPDPDPLTA